MGILIGLAVLSALIFGSVYLAAVHRRRRRIDQELEAFYVDHLERILAPESTDDAVLLSVFEHLAEFGAEVDAKLKDMEERLASQEAENRRLRNERPWSVAS
jgi:hypothetical protein